MIVATARSLPVRPNALKAAALSNDPGEANVRRRSTTWSPASSPALADASLARLQTPAAFARLAELAVHLELHQQQRAMEELGQCGDKEIPSPLVSAAASAMSRDAECQNQCKGAEAAAHARIIAEQTRLAESPTRE